jgi:hypothetical protein
LSEQREQPEEKKTRPARRRPPSTAVSTWLESQRRTEEMLNPPVLKMFAEQQSWVKAMSGAAAMPIDITKLFSTREFDFARGAIADYERTRRMLSEFTPLFEASGTRGRCRRRACSRRWTRPRSHNNA